MREGNPELHRQRVSESLRGNRRRWKGDSASYVAKHMWLTKHYAKPNYCEGCGRTDASRLE